MFKGTSQRQGLHKHKRQQGLAVPSCNQHLGSWNRRTGVSGQPGYQARPCLKNKEIQDTTYLQFFGYYTSGHKIIYLFIILFQMSYKIPSPKGNWYVFTKSHFFMAQHRQSKAYNSGVTTYSTHKEPNIRKWFTRSNYNFHSKLVETVSVWPSGLWFPKGIVLNQLLLGFTFREIKIGIKSNRCHD
jgi:hypothetical protein